MRQRQFYNNPHTLSTAVQDAKHASVLSNSKHCAHVRGYDDGTVTVRAMTCHRAAEILWQARRGRRDVSGFHCTINGTGPGGTAARGSVFYGAA